MISRKILIHALCWIIFIAYEISVSIYFGDQSSFVEFAAFYILDILLFYFNAHVIFLKFFSDRSFFRFATLAFFILIELVAYCYLSVCLNTILKNQNVTDIFLHIQLDVLIMSVWRGIYFLGLSIAYWAVSNNIKAIKRAKEAEVNMLTSQTEQEKLNAEIFRLQNAYLQTRINPHFLLNTLNFIYNQVEVVSLPAADNIVTLSEIMQYSLSTMGKDGKVPLNREINHIKNYIKLNQSRFDNKLNLNTEIINDVNLDKRIPPLLILTFVENIFKHGDLTDKDNPGIVQIEVINGALKLFTKNKKREFLNYKDKHNERVGIINAKTRLSNFYGNNRFKLNINQTETEFKVHLKIIL